MSRTTRTSVIAPHRMSSMIIGDSQTYSPRTGSNLVPRIVARKRRVEGACIGGGMAPICGNYSPDLSTRAAICGRDDDLRGDVGAYACMCRYARRLCRNNHFAVVFVPPATVATVSTT